MALSVFGEQGGADDAGVVAEDAAENAGVSGGSHTHACKSAPAYDFFQLYQLFRTTDP